MRNLPLEEATSPLHRLGRKMLGNGIFNIIQAVGTYTIFALMIITKKLEKEMKNPEYYGRLMRY